MVIKIIPKRYVPLGTTLKWLDYREARIGLIKLSLIKIYQAVVPLAQKVERLLKIEKLKDK